jgi:hypothetical protein
MITSRYITRTLNEIVSKSPSKIANEILDRYQTEDFKSVITSMSKEMMIPKVKLVQIFCNQTGTNAGDLPGGYSIHDFLKKPPPEPFNVDKKPPAPFQMSSPDQ